MSINYMPLSQMHPAKPVIKRKLPASSYLAIAQEVLRKTGIRHGNCLEINSDNAFFSIAMAQITGMQIYLMKNSERATKHIAFHLKQNNMTNRVQLIMGNPQQISLADQQINLAVYRKSIFGWRNHVKAFQEIYRILAPGGAAYIRDDCWDGQKWVIIENKLKEYSHRLSEQLNGDVWPHRMENIKEKIIQAGITSFEMDCNDEGLWIIIRRPLAKENVS